MALFRAASATACTAVNGGATTMSTSVDVLDEAPEFLGEHDRVVHGLVHLPVAGDERGAHGGILDLGCRLRAASARGEARARAQSPSLRLYLSVSAATPGSTLPPRNSSDAPPPVEMCDTRSATPALWMAATESPPPMIVVPLHLRDRLGDGERALGEVVDLEDAHRTVPDDGLRRWRACRVHLRTVFGPMSRPIRSPIAGSSRRAPRSARRPRARRDDVIDRQLEADAAPLRGFRIARALSSLSSSTSDFPIGSPCALRNV